MAFAGEDAVDGVDVFDAAESEEDERGAGTAEIGRFADAATSGALRLMLMPPSKPTATAVTTNASKTDL